MKCGKEVEYLHLKYNEKPPVTLTPGSRKGDYRVGKKLIFMKIKLLNAFVIMVMIAIMPSCKSKTERLDDIVKDLSNESYSLHFDKEYPDFGITKTSYGAENYLVYADPGDLICGDPIIQKFKRGGIPIFRNPKIIWPTCPDLVPIDIGEKLKNIITKADAIKYAGLELVKLSNNSAFLASKILKVSLHLTSLIRLMNQY